MIQYLKVRPLSSHLEDWRVKIEGIAKDMGLDFSKLASRLCPTTR